MIGCKAWSEYGWVSGAGWGEGGLFAGIRHVL